MKTALKLVAVLPLILNTQPLLAAASDLQLMADLGAARQSADSEAGTAVSASVGVKYEFNPNWALSLNYVDYGDADILRHQVIVQGDIMTRMNVSADTTAAALYLHYMTDREPGGWSFGGKLGLVRWDTNLHMTIDQFGSLDGTYADSGIDLSAGVGASYALNAKWDLTIGADYMRYSIEDVGESLDVETTRFSVGVNYHF